MARLRPGARGFDCSVRLNFNVLTAAKQDGISFVAKYVPYGSASYRASNSKFWTPLELRLCADLGITATAVYEVNEGRPLLGAEKGRLDGLDARSGMNSLGMDPGQWIMAAVDYDVTQTNMAATIGYLRAFAATCGGQPSSYGDEDVAIATADMDPVICIPSAYGWSKSLWAARSGGEAARINAARGIPGIKIYQSFSTDRYGINIDPLTVLADVRLLLSEFGAGVEPLPPGPVTPAPPKPVPAPTPSPVPPSPQEDDDMAKPIAISSPDRNPAIVFADGSGIKMIGLAGGEEGVRILGAFGIAGITEVSTVVWDDFQKHAQA